MESIQEALNKIEEVLNSCTEFIKEARDKERLIAKLSGRIAALDQKRIETENSLKDHEAVFLRQQTEKGEQIIAEATKRGELRAGVIVSGAKAELLDLTSKNESLKNQIKELGAMSLKRSTEVSAFIKELESQKKNLIVEVDMLLKTKDDLGREVSAIKGKMAEFIK